MLSLLLVSTADSALGRFDVSNVSQQSLMELFVQGFDDVCIAIKDDESYYDISEWTVLLVGADSEVFGIIINNADSAAVFQNADRTIKKHCFPPGGTMDFQYVPPTVTHLNVSLMNMKGEIQTASLPRGLQTLKVNRNKLSGTFDAAGLPQRVQNVDISKNSLSGSLILDSLPTSLIEFIANANNFSGSINLGKLPPKLVKLNLSSNRLEGHLFLCNVPATLEEAEMHVNKFDTEKVIFDAKHKMKCFRVDRAFHTKVFYANGTARMQAWIRFHPPVNNESSSEEDAFDLGLMGDLDFGDEDGY